MKLNITSDEVRGIYPLKLLIFLLTERPFVKVDLLEFGHLYIQEFLLFFFKKICKPRVRH